MKKDFLQSLEYLAFTARIKRLSDNLMYDAKSVYKDSPLDIEPNWHLIFLLLKEEEALGVTEIAKKLGFSHPGIIKITKRMKEKGYLQSVTHKTDNRKQLLSLTDKSKEMLPELEKRWKHIEDVIKEFVSPELMEELLKTENAHKDQSIYQRINRKH
jgi:DNA-binding MarR family transcriptional regulator